MGSLETKKLALLRILQILERDTDCDHTLTQEEIIRKLDAEYGIEMERKAIARNVSLLKEAGYEIDTQNGTCMAGRLFEDSELKLLCDSVLASRHINPKHSKDLIEKLSSLSNKYFRSRINNVYTVNDWNKVENPSLFYTIDIIDEAIEKKRKIKLNYNRYGEDGKFTHERLHVVSPYQLIMHFQNYYVLTRNEDYKDVVYYRLDRISHVEILDEPATDIATLDGFQNGIDYRRITSAMPDMFTDEPQRITLETYSEWMIDQIVDWFGHNFKTEKKDGKITVTLLASPKAMTYWAMRYLDHVEVISPASLRKDIATLVKAANERYNPKN